MENAGQYSNRDIRFVHSSPSITAGFGESGYYLDLHGLDGSGALIHVTFPESNAVTPLGEDELLPRNHYFQGRESDRWVTNTRAFGSIVYPNLYPGIDLIFQIEDGSLKYDLRIAPRADPTDVRMSYRGADSLSLDCSGNLHVTAGDHSFVEERPFSYQTAKSDRTGTPEITEVRSTFFVRGTTVGFRIGTYDRNRELVIDPLLYSTFVGGLDDDLGSAIAMDSQGNIIIAGYTRSADFPNTTGAYDNDNNGGLDVFVLKFNPEGTDLIFSTYVGGSKDEGNEESVHPIALTLDSNGNIYVAGTTGSDDFPTTPDSYHGSYGGGESDLFAFKLLPDGSDLQYSTYLGGQDADFGSGVSIVLDPSNQAIITGGTFSDDFPTTDDAYDRTYHGNGDGVLLKLSADGTSLTYSTYLGGGQEDSPQGISLDGQGNIIISGSTGSDDFPTTLGSYDEDHNGKLDAFLIKMDVQGTELLYGTYVGSSEDDVAFDHVIDGEGRILLTGETASTGFPTVSGSHDRQFNGGAGDAYVTILSADGTELDASTFIGGSGRDRSASVALDSDGNVLVSGTTWSPTFPTTPDCHDDTHDGDSTELFVSRFDGSLISLEYSSFIGGSETERTGSLMIDEDNNLILVGSTDSTDLSTTPASYDDSHNGELDAFLYKLNLLTANISSITPDPGLNTDTITFTGLGRTGGDIVEYHWFSNLDGDLYIGEDDEFEIANLSIGTHIIALRVKDDLGYRSDDVQSTLIIHAPPTAHIDSILPSPALETDTVEFTGHGTDDGSVAGHEWESSIDGSLHSGQEPDFTTDALSNGTHTIIYRVQDNYGVWSEEVTRELVVNGIPRISSVTIDPTWSNEGDEVIFNGSATDDGSITEYRWRSSIDGNLSNTSSFNSTSLSNGTHVIYFCVKDDMNTWSAEFTSEIHVNGRPRAIIDSITPNFATEGETVEFLGSGFDDGSIDEYHWISSIDGYIGNTSSFNLTNLNTGHHTILLEVKDDSGVWSEWVVSSVSINGIPTAEIVSILPDHPTEGEEVTFIGTGSDDGRLENFNWTSSIDGPLSTNKTFSTSDLSQGNHTISFRVQDNLSIWSEEVFMNISVNDRPIAVIVSILPDHPTEGDEVTFSGTGSDTGNLEDFNWESSIDGFLSWNMTFTVSNLSYGFHEISFRVMDEHGIWSVPAVAHISVNRFPVAIINDISPIISTEGSPVHLDGAGVDDGDIVNYVWFSDLQGLVGTTNKTVLTNLTIGDHTISFQVMDDQGVWSKPVSRSLTINPMPTLHLSVDPDTVRQGEQIEISTNYSGHEKEISISIRDPTNETIFPIMLTIGGDGRNKTQYTFAIDVPPGLYTVTAFTGNVSTSTPVTVTPFDYDIPHTIINVSIIPINDDQDITLPLSSSDLKVIVDVKNEDNDELVYSYIWYVNDNEIETELPELDSSYIKTGDVVKVKVLVNDTGGFHTAVLTSDPPIIILNTPPVIRDAGIVPIDPAANNDLTVHFDFYDHDEDTMSGSIFKWVKNRGLGHGWETVELDGPMVFSELTNRDEQWSCTIIPSDGTSFGEPFTIDPVTIRNSVPVAEVSSPSPGGTYYIGQEIEFDSRTSFDIDGDDLEHTWTVDGEEVRSKQFFRSFPEGDHHVEYVVSDGVSLSRRTFIITIVDEPHPDLFTSPAESYVSNLDPNGRGRVGRELSFTVFVWNKGDVEASATVVFSLGSSGETPLGTKEVRVPAKGYDTAFVTWNPDAAGYVLIYAVVQGSNPAESDETNNIAYKNITIETTPEPPVDGSPDSAVVVVSSVSIGLIAISIAGYEPWKYRFFLFLAPLYTKLNHNNRMDNENRSKILGFVMGVEEGKRESGALPGVSYSTIKKKLQFSNGALAYHLSVLEREGDIRSEKVGKYRLYFPTKIQKPKTMFLERLTELQQKLVEEIKTHSEVSQKRLVRSMKESQQVISYNLNRLEQKGIIFLKKRGNRSYCSLNPEYLSNQ